MYAQTIINITEIVPAIDNQKSISHLIIFGISSVSIFHSLKLEAVFFQSKSHNIPQSALTYDIEEINHII
ncbi:MAG: hypothetical protein P1U46_01980 [Patescibacteria group bacterium]|nr:hypothetical protein [Patescibacteria group bacterium]